MKFNRQQIEEQLLTVWQTPSAAHPRGRRFALVESADTDTGTVLFWTVPSTDLETLKAERKFTEAHMSEPPLEVDLILKEVIGVHITVLDAYEKVVAEGPKADEKRSD